MSILLGAGMFSCKENEQYCDITSYKELSLEPVKTVLKIPNYVITDTISYGDISNFFERDIQSVDSTFSLMASITTYAKDPEAMPDAVHRMASQKEHIESTYDSMRLITQTFRNIDSIKIGYLKYIDEKRKLYEGRIFFNKGVMYTDIWLYEKYDEESNDRHSIIDCVFENIQVK